MRRWLRVWAILILAAALNVPALSEEFNSEALGVGLTVPESWFEVAPEKVEELGLGKSAVFVSDDGGEQCALIVSREPLAGRTVEAFILRSVYVIYNDMAGHILSEEEVTIGGEKGYRFVYEAGPKQGDKDFMRFYRVLVRRGESMYIFQASNSRKNFVKREGELFALMKSVIWLNDNK